MKVYLYYIVAHDLSDFYAVLPTDIIEEDGMCYALYAYTTSKKEMHEFEHVRKKELFYKKIIRLNEKDLEKFMDQHPNEVLGYHEFLGNHIKDNKICSKYYMILSTVMEYECISFHGYDYFLEKMSEIDDKYISSLYKIIKKKVYNIIKNDIGNDIIKDLQVPLDDYRCKYFTLNELEVYNHLFENTYNEGGVYENALLSFL